MFASSESETVNNHNKNYHFLFIAVTCFLDTEKMNLLSA